MKLLTSFTASLLATASIAAGQNASQSVVDLNVKEPSVCKDWAKVSAAMLVEFSRNANRARSCIRLAFHDCFLGCDGSTVLSEDERARQENKAFRPGAANNCADFAQGLKKQFTTSKFTPSVADVIVLAGSASTLVPQPASA
jgi:hypothetical protein